MKSRDLAALVAMVLFGLALIQFLDAPTRPNLKALAIRAIPLL